MTNFFIISLFFRLLQNLSQRLISIPENEILDQAAQAAAAAAAVAAAAAAATGDVVTAQNAVAAAAAAALVSSTLSTTSSDSSSSSSTNSDSSQEMDIDIIQVQENVTVDADGAMVFPCAAATTNSLSTATPTTNTTTSKTTITSTDAQQTNNSTNNISPTNVNSTTTATSTNAPQSQVDAQDFNTVKNTNDCHHQQHQSRQLNNPLWWRENLNLDKSKLILIGFSKGCVVLNQVSLGVKIVTFCSPYS